jgi:hypothetical protein
MISAWPQIPVIPGEKILILLVSGEKLPSFMGKRHRHYKRYITRDIIET